MTDELDRLIRTIREAGITVESPYHVARDTWDFYLKDSNLLVDVILPHTPFESKHKRHRAQEAGYNRTALFWDGGEPLTALAEIKRWVK